MLFVPASLSLSPFKVFSHRTPAMRKGTKRKTTYKPNRNPAEEDQTNEGSQSPAEETNSEEPSRNAEPEPVKEAAGKGSPERAKVAKLQEEPEYFSEKCNLEDLWLQVFPLGTEWDYLDAVYQCKWNFSNLEGAFEEGGELHNKKVYLFGCTELLLDDQGKTTHVPVVVAVVSPFPPSDKISFFEKLNDEIVPMKQMKLDWVPYIPLESGESQGERPKDSQFFILSSNDCNERRVGLRHLKIDRLKQFENCMPYFYNPLQKDELEQSTVVELLFPIDPKPVVCKFDWELDEIEGFTDRLIEEGELPAAQKEPFKSYAREKICEAEKANREARESVKKAWDKLDQQSKAAFEKTRFNSFFKCDYNPDVTEKFTDMLIEKEGLSADQKEPLTNFVREKIRDAEKAIREARESPKKTWGELGQQSKAAFKKVKFYKFYPVSTPDTPDVSDVKSPYINMYCPQAHKVI